MLIAYMFRLNLRGTMMGLEYRKVLTAIDARPFRPLKIEIIRGREIDVTHPDDIVVLTNPQRVHPIKVYQSDPWDMAILWQEGIAGLLDPVSDISPCPGDSSNPFQRRCFPLRLPIVRG